MGFKTFGIEDSEGNITTDEKKLKMWNYVTQLYD
jgi:hypothetical protein